ncbi:hypothetical protein ACFX2C_029256 [Malus domestica]
MAEIRQIWNRDTICQTNNTSYTILPGEDPSAVVPPLTHQRPLKGFAVIFSSVIFLLSLVTLVIHQGPGASPKTVPGQPDHHHQYRPALTSSETRSFSVLRGKLEISSHWRLIFLNEAYRHDLIPNSAGINRTPTARMAWFSGKVSLGNFPDLARAVKKLQESIKNIEKNFDIALGFEDREKAESGNEALGLWPSSTDWIMSFREQQDEESNVESSEKAGSSKLPPK